VVADAIALIAALELNGATHWWGWFAAALVVAVVGMRTRSSRRLTPSAADELPGLIVCVATPVALLAVLIGQATTSLALVRVGVAAVALLVAARVGTRGVVRWIRRRGLLVEPTIIVGAGSRGVDWARTLIDHPEYGLCPIGFLDDAGRLTTSLPVLGSLESFDAVLREHRVRQVVIASDEEGDPTAASMVRSCDLAGVDVRVAPRPKVASLPIAEGEVESVWALPLVRLRPSALRSGSWCLKRPLETCATALALVPLAPVYLACTVAVRLSSPGPVLLHQRRIGRGGRPFDLLKFRSMRVNSDSDITWSVDSDSRITAVGRFLRRTALDELPQLINVVRGEMSLVGPRPERPSFVRQFELEVPDYSNRHRVPPGITGWAQIHGLRGDTSISDRARFDNEYVDSWSLWKDVVIVGRTAMELARGSGPESCKSASRSVALRPRRDGEREGSERQPQLSRLTRLAHFLGWRRIQAPRRDVPLLKPSRESPGFP
jgi:exopolysaccharide biosynthesis polyprenyl glycosylphosphotransferase